MAQVCSHGAGQDPKKESGRVPGVWAQGMELIGSQLCYILLARQTRHRAIFKKCWNRFSLFMARAAKSSANGYRKRKRNDLWPLGNLPHRTDT